MYCPSCIPTKAGSVCDFYPVSGNFNDALIDLLTVDAANNLYRIKMINHNLYLTPASNSSGAALTWENASNADNQIWQLCASQSSGGGSTGGSTTITMPVNANQNYSGNSSWIINYCGDVLLQKTFTDNVLTGGPKKNTGQLPQYYIENNHEGIVTKQMYREVQAEIARRNSKSCANRRKQKRGRYNSKYALSERLYCGECGSPYKRVTWNIHGRKEIVWRCVNRVTYGTKFCHNSPSVQEEALHQTLLRAIQNLADNYTEEVAMQINGILHDLQGGTTELEKLQQKLADSQQEFDRLLDMSLECDASFLDEKLKHASEEIDNLQKQVDQLTASQQKAANPNLQLTDSDFRITEYSDTLVARIIERIEVISAVRIKIEFIGGYTVTVPLQS